MQESTAPDTTQPETPGGRGRHPNSLANLRPPFGPNNPGNPSGLTKDGRPPKQAAIERHLQTKLQARKGKAKKTWAERIVDTWVENAAKGDAQARRDLLERLYPVPKDETSKSVVLEGLRLELTGSDGTKASLEAIRGEAPRPELPPAGESFVETE